VKDCGDVERLDAQSGSDTDSSRCLLEETKQVFFSTLIHTGFCEHWLILQVMHVFPLQIFHCQYRSFPKMLWQFLQMSKFSTLQTQKVAAYALCSY